VATTGVRQLARRSVLLFRHPYRKFCRNNKKSYAATFNIIFGKMFLTITKNRIFSKNSVFNYITKIVFCQVEFDNPILEPAQKIPILICLGQFVRRVSVLVQALLCRHLAPAIWYSLFDRVFHLVIAIRTFPSP
jgi:hypothetical protein